jgi:hypothetical protein
MPDLDLHPSLRRTQGSPSTSHSPGRPGSQTLVTQASSTPPSVVPPGQADSESPGRVTLPMMKASLGIGNGESGHHRAGGTYARAANQELMSADAQRRAEKIFRLLGTGVGNLHVFEGITPWMMGPESAQLAEAYQQLAGRSLSSAISTAFSSREFMQSYLLDIVEKGEPGLGSRLALASGLVTSTKGDWPEVLRLLRASDAAAITEALTHDKLRQHLESSRRVKAVIDVALKTEAHDEAVKGVESAAEDDPAALQAAEARASVSKQELYAAKNAELVAIVSHRLHPGRGLQRDKLIADLIAWAKEQEQDVRDQAVAPESPFYQILQRQAASASPVTRLSQPDFRYLLAVTRSNAAMAAELLGPEPVAKVDLSAEPKTEEELEDEASKAREKREEVAKETGAKVFDLDAYVARKGESNHALKIQHWSTLKSKIEGMDDDQRAAYLRQQMSDDERAIFDGEGSTAQEREAVRAKAVQAIRQRLLEAGMKSEVADRVLAAFQSSAAPDSSRYHSTYQKLRRLALGRPRLQFSHEAFRLVGQLANQEYLQVRRDAELMAALETRCDGAVWTQIQQVLGHDPLSSEGADLAGKEARELGSNQAELRPAHWTALLQRELGKNALARKQDKVLSVATRAYYAALRRSALPPNDQGRDLALPHGLPPIPVVEFTAEVLAGLSEQERAQLQREDAAGFESLSAGRAVTATERVEGATFGAMSLKRLKGSNARPSDIMRAIDDAQGSELLQEWSNVAQWRELFARRAQVAATAASDEQRAELVRLDGELRTFIVDVNPEIHQMLRDRLPRAKLVGALTKLREKLGAAMSSDPTFRAAMIAAGMHVDDYEAERTRGIAALDQQRMEDSGAQWNQFMGIGVSAKSAEGKESRNILAGRLRGAHGTIEESADREAARVQVNEDQVPKIEEAREEHADRMKAAQKVKERANQIATTVVGILITIAITGATIGTGTLATLGPQVGMALAKAAAAGTLRAALKRALEGDRFNAVDTITGITMDLMVASVLSAGLGGTNGLNALAEDSAGLKGKKDSASVFSTAMMKWAINTAVREAITTTAANAMDADPSKITLDQTALIKLRAWVEDFALAMAVTEARGNTSDPHNQYATALIPGIVKPITAELGRPIDDRLKAERGVRGKATVADADVVTPQGVSAEQLQVGREQLRVTEGPQAAPAARSAHGVTADELQVGREQLRVTEGPQAAPAARSAHGVTADELQVGREQLRVTEGPQAAPAARSAHGVTADELQVGREQLVVGEGAGRQSRLDALEREINRADAMAEEWRQTIARHGASLAPGLVERSRAQLTTYQHRTLDAWLILAQPESSIESLESAASALRVLHDRADDENCDLVVAVMDLIRVPTHMPVAAAEPEPDESSAEQRPQPMAS